MHKYQLGIYRFSEEILLCIEKDAKKYLLKYRENELKTLGILWQYAA
jgi:hypothetical protein